MLFNSYTFLIFLAVVLGVTRIRWSWTGKKVFLLLMSYLFYAAWNPPFVVLLWISTLADWFLARWMFNSPRRKVRRVCLVASLSVNLGLLGYFKYAGFVLENLQQLLGGVGVVYQPPALDIILPVGISFYTFQTLSYTLDVYRGSLKPSRRFVDYALYVTFFPQLVAGPIVRASEFLPQCESPRRATSEQLGWGLALILVGLFSKVVIADFLMSPVAETVYAGSEPMGFVAAWMGTLAFAVQIFCDFSGYSTCAIGAALCLGFRIPDNFRHPYAALGFSDFWRRWHISLSTWLRDYLYISLGGNRKGSGRTYGNLMFTMLVGGLWHGASWSFVVWGGLHGLFLVAERLVRPLIPDRPFWRGAGVRAVVMLLTFVAVCFTWVYFRASDFALANALTGAMLGRGETWAGVDVLVAAQALSVQMIGAVIALVVGYHWFMRNRSLEQVAAKIGPVGSSVALGVMMVLVFLSMGGPDRAFIYFQF